VLANLLVTWTHVPLAPAVLGLLLLLAVIAVVKRAAPRALKHDAPLETGARLLLRWFPLFFVPPAVGVVQSSAILRAAWAPMLVVLVASTFAGIAVTVVVLRLLSRHARA
jgi:putative effector of murein hydrolase LrgA (UPF0299 family)